MTTHKSYGDLVDMLDYQGQVVTARGLRTKELLARTLLVSSDLVPTRPGMASALGYMEACQFIAGTFDYDALVRVAPKADHSLFTQQMAYGPRQAVGEYILPQLYSVIEELAEDESSRRAVITLPTPDERLHIRPCTSTIQFLVRAGVLETIVSMRSWDVWWGLPYDITMFNVIAHCVASCLGVEPDWTVVFAGSVHLYEPHWGLSPHPDRVRMESHMQHQQDLRLWQDWAQAQIDNKDWLTGPPEGFTQTRI